MDDLHKLDDDLRPRTRIATRTKFVTICDERRRTNETSAREILGTIRTTIL